MTTYISYRVGSKIANSETRQQTHFTGHSAHILAGDHYFLSHKAIQLSLISGLLATLSSLPHIYTCAYKSWDQSIEMTGRSWTLRRSLCCIHRSIQRGLSHLKRGTFSRRPSIFRFSKPIIKELGIPRRQFTCVEESSPCRRLKLFNDALRALVCKCDVSWGLAGPQCRAELMAGGLWVSFDSGHSPRFYNYGKSRETSLLGHPSASANFFASFTVHHEWISKEWNRSRQFTYAKT